MSVDRQLPLEPTERIDPSTQVVRMPGTDAICECHGGVKPHPFLDHECRWPFCDPPTEEDECSPTSTAPTTAPS